MIQPVTNSTFASLVLDSTYEPQEMNFAGRHSSPLARFPTLRRYWPLMGAGLCCAAGLAIMAQHHARSDIAGTTDFVRDRQGEQTGADDGQDYLMSGGLGEREDSARP
jgi:hypothetical protein